MGSDAEFMALAIEQGQMAGMADEVPVGAIVVKDGLVIGIGRNSSIATNDPTAHAEINALRCAALALGNYRLENCDIFVTLEPCAMCAGAMLHARLRRVVFGATEPKTGAAGSTIDLFKNKSLNHQTTVSGGVLAQECADVLKDFFKKKRSSHLSQQQLLRDDALRTPDSRFSNLPEYPWHPHFESQLTGLLGLRLHYLDEGPKSTKPVFFCIHGYRGWSYSFRKVLPIWTSAGFRVVAPDLIGFGKSDKPKREIIHTKNFHRDYLIALMQMLNLCNIVLVTPDMHDGLGLVLRMKEMDLYKATLVIDDFFPERASSEIDAYNAPFPDAGHKAALRTFSAMRVAVNELGQEADELIAQVGITRFPA